MSYSVPQQAHQNVWVARFDVNYYKILASIQSDKFEFSKYGKVYEYLEETEEQEILKRKEEYFALGLELERANHFFHQSKIVPDKLWIENSETQLPNKSDYIFDIKSGGILFNQACATILKKHRLGETILTPVQIYDLSTGDRVSDETYYFLNLYERRTYICNPQSDSMFIYIQGSGKYSTRGAPINNEVLEIDRSALACDVDLWHDPRILGYFFMSESLYHALAQAGMIDKFDPSSCNLIQFFN